LKSLPNDEYHGMVQPMRALNASILSSGARETSTNEMTRGLSRVHRPYDGWREAKRTGPANHKPSHGRRLTGQGWP
jgi:hypothetical protein